MKFLIFAIMLLCLPLPALSQGYPQRMISLGPQITEELYLLGVGDRLVANTVYCQNPPEAAKKEKVGTVVEVNLERIISLKPDLVLATSLTSPKAVEKLKALGINVVSFPLAKDFGEISKNFLKLGRIVGKEKEAERIVKMSRRRVDSIQAKVDRLHKPSVFVQVGARPLFTMTKDSFINDFIELAGGINIASNAKSGLYSREEVLEQNPDVIIIMTMGIVGEEEKRFWQRYKTLNAVKNNRIYIMDSYKLGSPTPVNFVETLEEIANMLHPENKIR